MAQLVDDLASLGDVRLRRVILTLNLPETDLVTLLRRRAWPFSLETLENATPKGFGANHNQAFALDTKRGPSEMFVVSNPDIGLRSNPFDSLLRRMVQDGARVGACYPVQVDARGFRQDHERLLPTPARLLQRYLRGDRRPELGPGDQPDWVNGAFLLLRREAYASIGGFDEGYRMYCEDVDLCLRLQVAGWQLVRADDATVVHGAQRASHHNLRHMTWHVRSLLRLWCSRSWRIYRANRARDQGFLDSSHTP